MPTRNVNLTEHYDQFVNEQITAGRFRNASEVMLAASPVGAVHARRATENRSAQVLGGRGLCSTRPRFGIEIKSDRELASFIGRLGRRAARLAETCKVEIQTRLSRCPRCSSPRSAEQDIVAICLRPTSISARPLGFDPRLLLMQAFRDIAANPSRPGSCSRPELVDLARTYHLHFSRHRVPIAVGRVRTRDISSSIEYAMIEWSKSGECCTTAWT